MPRLPFSLQRFFSKKVPFLIGFLKICQILIRFIDNFVFVFVFTKMFVLPDRRRNRR